MGGPRPRGFENLNPSVSQPAQTARDKGKMHGEIVSLRLEMAAYFRRPMAVSLTDQPQEQ
jgi:hypothetical protein